jgi:hypothetical protein
MVEGRKYNNTDLEYFNKEPESKREKRFKIKQIVFVMITFLIDLYNEHNRQIKIA